MIIVIRVGFGRNGTWGEMMTELIEKEGKEIGQILNENWTNFSNFILPSNGVRQLDIVYHNLYEFYERSAQELSNWLSNGKVNE